VSKITIKDLHKVEMELVSLYENNEITTDAIIERFTDLMNLMR
jgi:hypothetical protein